MLQRVAPAVNDAVTDANAHDAAADISNAISDDAVTDVTDAIADDIVASSLDASTHDNVADVPTHTTCSCASGCMHSDGSFLLPTFNITTYSSAAGCTPTEATLH